MVVHGHHNPAAHIPSGHVSVGPHGATVAGPSGSVSTDNGLHGHHAGARLAGPSGTVAGWGHHGVVEGPTGVNHGHGHDGWDGHHGHGHVVVAPVHHVVAPVHHVVAAPVHVGWGHGGWGHGWGHGHSVVVAHGHHGW